MDSLRQRYIFFIAVVILGGALFSPAPAGAAVPDIHGFSELAGGVKTSDDNTKRDSFNLLEERLQLKSSYGFEDGSYFARKGAVLNFKGDFTVDAYYDGKTDFDLRELNLSWTPLEWMDAKFGRQVLTWGTGDYLFINDLFPKDYESFFTGRGDEYLKKPSDAFKLSVYPSWGNIDFMAARFTANTTATGDRLSFFDSFQGGIAGRNSDRHLIEPPLQASNNEYALRLYRHIGSYELALYSFSGFNKNPDSYKDETTRQMFYRRMDAYGASLRGPFLGGIGSAEFGYDNSLQDPDGNNRLIENSMVKFLSGYEKDLGNDLKVGFQYFYEQRLDDDNYTENLLAGDFIFDESRHLLTQRLTRLYKNQTVTISLFNFYSPTDKDGYVRPLVSYDVTDQWKLAFGANLPWGEDDVTEFGQMKRNKNVYVRARCSF